MRFQTVEPDANTRPATWLCRMVLLGIALVIAAPVPASAAPKKRVLYDDLSGGIQLQFSVVAKWGHTDLTYGFVNGTSDIAEEEERQAVRDALKLWSDATPLTFSEVAAENAEIKISWATGSHGDAFPFDGINGVLAHAFYPEDGDIHFDDAETWTMSTRSSAAQPIDLVTVAAHELGHSLGLGHSSVTSALMYAFYGGSHRYLATDDTEGIQSAYGSNPGTRFFLRNSLTAGIPNILFAHGKAGDRAIAGDWNNDGTDTIGFYRNGDFYLRNSNSSGSSDLNFSFANPGDLPLAGDWNGDGTDTIGVYRPSNRTFYLRNSNSGGAPDITADFGNVNDLPVMGDWDGDGDDTIGVYRPSTGDFYLRDSNSEGAADYSFSYGNSGDVPVAGDWEGKGKDLIGVFRPSTGVWFLEQDALETSSPEWVFAYGNVGPRSPLVGDWDKDGDDSPGTFQ